MEWCLCWSISEETCALARETTREGREGVNKTQEKAG